MEPFKDWLVLETAIFFIYIFSTSLFMIIHMIKGWCGKKNGEKIIFSNKKKQITDFVIYEEYNILWFSFNCVLISMPIVVLIFIWVKIDLLKLYYPDSISSITILMSVTGAMLIGSLIQLISLPKIYEHE